MNKNNLKVGGGYKKEEVCDHANYRLLLHLLKTFRFADRLKSMTHVNIVSFYNLCLIYRTMDREGLGMITHALL